VTVERIKSRQCTFAEQQVRLRTIVEVFEAVILQPEDVEVELVALD